MRIGEYFDGPPMGATPSAANKNTSTALPDVPESEEIAVLAGLGIGKPLIGRLARRAHANGTNVEAELLADGTIREDAYFAGMARFLRLPFIARIDASDIVDSDMLDVQLLRPNQIRLQHAKQTPQVAIVPEAGRLAELAALLDRLPALRQGLAISTPSQIRAAVWEAGAMRRAKAAVGDLFETRAHSSARIVLSGAQGFLAGCAAFGIVIALAVAPQITLPWLHVVLSLLYFGTLLLRITALTHNKHNARTVASVAAPTTIGHGATLPTYTIMVALYREAAVAAQLVHSLERMDWPHSLLDIKLVCEADDDETIAALHGLQLKPHFEIVKVPPCQPRTKPKALTYALCAARGEFLAIYDAEDRPHPQQLREALARFREGPPEIACLQAPLVITNASRSFVSALFAVEYSALFRGLLPMLAAYRMPLPLGGTSNHFRTEVLRSVGGWDPFNVTEDADLGVRLYRHGYRAATLRRQTLEDAPTSLRVWLGQRTRWYKGWVQTWLVATRHPRQHVREMGLKGAFVFHLMIGGMLVSALLHPLILLLAATGINAMMQDTDAVWRLFGNPLVLIDVFNILASYALFVVLGFKTMTGHEKRLVGWRWAAVPLYWMMTSLAAWKAVNELRTNPFFWNKTPHRPVDGSVGTKK